jgi:hypothetical protein
LSSWRPLRKIPGSGSGSGIGSVQGFADPDLDPYLNVTDPQHCFPQWSSMFFQCKLYEQWLFKLQKPVSRGKFIKQKTCGTYICGPLSKKFSSGAPISVKTGLSGYNLRVGNELMVTTYYLWTGAVLCTVKQFLEAILGLLLNSPCLQSSIHRHLKMVGLGVSISEILLHLLVLLDIQTSFNLHDL